MTLDDINKIETIADYLWALWHPQMNKFRGVDRQDFKEEVEEWIKEIKRTNIF